MTSLNKGTNGASAVLSQPEAFMSKRRNSFIELNARERAIALMDAGSWRELAGPFDRLESPWLMPQNITPECDDGCIILKGKIDGTPSVVIALEPAFQGGSVGEVSGAKICAALDLACRDSKNGIKTNAVLMLETGGVRLSEANLGLAAVAEVVSSLIALRQHAPVVCIIAGGVGCFGGMSLAAALSSYVIMTAEGRLGLNGPEVIEQEGGIEEFDSSDRALIWAIDGGEQRYLTGLADALVRDDVGELVESLRVILEKGLPSVNRSSEYKLFRQRISELDCSKPWKPEGLRATWKRNC